MTYSHIIIIRHKILCFVRTNQSKERGEIVPKCSANHKQTSKSVASKASKILTNGSFSKTSKSVAGSALAQTKKSK